MSTKTEEAFSAWERRTRSPAHSRRTAARNAAFFLPHVRAGMALLDCGCGPGSITLGLAEAVSSGRAVGIDVSSEAVEAARTNAELRELPAVEFAQADGFHLPFADGSFDAAFLHAVLQHLDDPRAVLGELRRVLRPGGVIGVADADYGGSVLAPTDPMLERSLALLVTFRQRGPQGDPFVGRRLRGLLNDAGFANVIASATAGSDGTSDVTERSGQFWANYFAAPEFAAFVTELGLATPLELQAMSEAWRAWGRDPAAFWARFWCEAVGFVP
jgi:SAM-dependent methyltransferase